jgi:hypothetical protein
MNLEIIDQTATPDLPEHPSIDNGPSLGSIALQPDASSNTPQLSMDEYLRSRNGPVSRVDMSNLYRIPVNAAAENAWRDEKMEKWHEAQVRADSPVEDHGNGSGAKVALQPDASSNTPVANTGVLDRSASITRVELVPGDTRIDTLKPSGQPEITRDSRDHRATTRRSSRFPRFTIRASGGHRRVAA